MKVNDSLISLAKEHGATKGLAGKILFTEEQLEAYNRALVAPYVGALKFSADNVIAGKRHVIDDILTAHREMFGGE